MDCLPNDIMLMIIDKLNYKKGMQTIPIQIKPMGGVVGSVRTTRPLIRRLR
jgi:hypothetical protein